MKCFVFPYQKHQKKKQAWVNEMGFIGNVAGNFFKILTTLGAIAVGFYVIMEFRLWSMDWTEYFIKVGRWEEIVFVTLVVMAISMVVLWLLKWHVRAQAGGR